MSFEILDNEETQLHLIDLLVSPKVADHLRCRASPTRVRALYHFYQLEKKVASGEWTDIHQTKESIAKGAQISRRHLTEFINSPEAALFMDVEHRPRKQGSKRFQSNLYRVKPWVIRIFRFFEVTGMMKGFRTCYEKWRATFKKRFDSWLMPRIQVGLNLDLIFKKKALMNKLSTRSGLKGSVVKGLKGSGIKYPSGSSIKPSGSKSNIELPVINDFVEISGKLRDRFMLKEADINQVMRNYSVSQHKRALVLGEQWLRNGMEVSSPIRAYQTCLNRTRAGAS